MDQLIRSERRYTLLTWRDDGCCRSGWHVPVIRFNEFVADRIKVVALTELVADVIAMTSPLVNSEVLHPSRMVRDTEMCRNYIDIYVDKFIVRL